MTEYALVVLGLVHAHRATPPGSVMGGSFEGVAEEAGS